MRDLEIQDRGLEPSGQPVVGDGAVRIPDARLDLDDEAVEPSAGLFVADVQRLDLGPEVLKD